MSDLPSASPEIGISTVPLPERMITEKPLDFDSMVLLKQQWGLFNALKDQSGPSVNPIRERLARGEPALAKGTLVHGSLYSPELVEGVSRMGIVSGELIGIPEDGETNYCADFFKVPENMSIQEYMAFIAQRRQLSERLSTHQPEFSFLPNYNKQTNQIAFLIDPDTRLQDLLSQDAYDPNNEVMKRIVHGLPPAMRAGPIDRISAILIGIPSNFISGMIIGSQVNAQEVQHIRQVMGDEVVLFDTLGVVLSPQDS